MRIATQAVERLMAKTNKIARYIKDPPALERPEKRSAPARPSVLYLLELRSHHAEAQSPLPKRKIVITIDPKDSAHSFCKEIKITRT
jgi:hypothetical protein